MRWASLTLRFLLVMLTAAGAGEAQQEPKPKELPDAPVAKQNRAPQKREITFHSTIEILGRRSIFFPKLAATPGPLSSVQKFELFADESIAPSHVMISVIGAGISQAKDSFPGYGQGMEGYGKRLGASIATSTADHFFGTFLLPSILERDPRYFPTLHGGPGHRIWYALSRTVVTRTDAGGQAVNWPGIMSPLLAESLANSYLPAREQTAGRTFQRYGLRIGFTAVGSVIQEYWPTIFRSLRSKKSARGSQSAPAASEPPAPGATRPSP